MTKLKDPWTDEIALEGHRLVLQPLARPHLESLTRNLCGKPGGKVAIASWHGFHSNINTEADVLEKLITPTHQARQEKIGNGFAMVLKDSGEAVGVSRYMELKRRHHSLEIGGTWIGADWQKTFVNTEAKLLMLSHAFEVIACQRVEFRVDSLNFNSQRAVLRSAQSMKANSGNPAA
jgi:RimJ/RimL family protein N-acetyltransferase